MKRSLCLILIFLASAFASNSLGAIITAASPASSDVQSAINQAKNGDTVIVPSGSAVWNSTVTITQGITLVGGGNTNGVTSITQGGAINQVILSVNVSGVSCTVKCFTWNESFNDNVTASFICLSGSFYRFCSNVVNCLSGLTVDKTDGGSGLIDNNQFTFGSGDCLNIFGSLSDSGNNSWTYGTGYGGATNYVYVEHNIVNSSDTSVYLPDGFIDGYDGARFVMRYNILTNATWGWHGTDSGSGSRSCHSYEIYGNLAVFTGANPPYWNDVFNSRGGTGLIFSNTIVNWFAINEGHAAFLMQYYRENSSYYPWGQFPDQYDGWAPGGTPTGYPGLDQQGYTGRTIFGPTNSTQVQSPTYVWGNTGMNVGATDSVIQQGRDYFLTAPPFSYTPLPYPYPLGGVTIQSTTNPPQITTQPANLVVATGQAATFSLTASGTAPLSYQWRFNSAAIANATSSSYTIAAALTNNAGSYTAIVTNNVGSVTSLVANLTVTAQTQTQTQTVNYYYVATNGNDSSGNGSIGSPWATVDHATSMMNGGDVLYIRGGVYNQIFDIYGPSGSSNYPTTVEAYPGETPIFNHNNVSSQAHSMDKLNWFKLSGLTIMSNNIGMIVGYAGPCANVTLSNMTFTDIGQQGLQVMSNSYNILIISNTVSNTGLWIYNGEGMYLGEGDSAGIMDNTHNVTVMDCLIYNTKDEAIEIKPGTYNMTVSNCTVYSANIEQDQYGAGGGAIEVDEEGTYNRYNNDPNHLICNNTVYNTPIGIRAGNGGEYYNNIVYAVTANGILVNNNDSDSYTRYVLNNTVDAPLSIAIINNGATASILNNIGPAGSYNLATANAYYVNESLHDYRLAAGSAPIKAGTNLFSMVQIDFEGTNRPATGPFDIGAYQYVVIPSPPTNLRTVPPR